MYLILGIIVFGMAIGAVAQFIVGRQGGKVNWGQAIVAGLVGSFVGGLVISLLAGDGLHFRPSGIIGSLAGAVLVTLAWRWWEARGVKATAQDHANKRSGDPRKSNPR